MEIRSAAHIEVGVDGEALAMDSPLRLEIEPAAFAGRLARQRARLATPPDAPPPRRLVSPPRAPGTADRHSGRRRSGGRLPEPGVAER